MSSMPALRVALIALVLPTAAVAQTASNDLPPAEARYAGQQGRAIKSLSAADLEALGQGAGWGLARAAELNGVPGPTHLLELADEIGLDPDQRSAIETIRVRMQADAIAAAAQYIAAERALDTAFRDAVPEPAALARLVAEAGRARGHLRLVHLSAHLAVLPLLTRAQVARYQILRGYAEDPCDGVPQGHDRDMWRRHNGCG